MSTSWEDWMVGSWFQKTYLYSPLEKVLPQKIVPNKFPASMLSRNSRSFGSVGSLGKWNWWKLIKSTLLGGIDLKHAPRIKLILIITQPGGYTQGLPIYIHIYIHTYISYIIEYIYIYMILYIIKYLFNIYIWYYIYNIMYNIIFI